MNKPAFTKTQIYLLWGAIIAGFAAFITLLAYLYPAGVDDVIRINSAKQIIIDYFFYAIDFNPKIGSLFSLAFIYFGKSWFLVFHPFIVTASVLLIFFVLFGRLPNFKEVKDIPAFGFISLAYIFCVARPDNVLFWMVGSCTYSWTMFLFLILMALLRGQLEGALKLPKNLYIAMLIFVLGLCVGMMNENNAPMAFIFCSLFWAWHKYKKEKLPYWFYFAAAGLALGIAILFSASGSYNRLADPIHLGFRNSSVMDKLIMNIAYVNELLAVNMLFPVIAGVAGIVALFDGKRDLKNKDLWLSILFAGTFFALAGALAFAPRPPMRAFYSASIFGFMAMLLCLKYWGKIYKINLIKYAFYALFVYCAVILPSFTIPYFNLHRQEKARQIMLNKQLAQGRVEVIVPLHTIIKGPTENYTIEFYDPFRGRKEYQQTQMGFYRFVPPCERTGNESHTSATI